MQWVGVPGGCRAAVHAALCSPAATRYALPASDTSAAPLVAALQSTRHDRAACCHSHTPPPFQPEARVTEQGMHSAARASCSLCLLPHVGMAPSVASCTCPLKMGQTHRLAHCGRPNNKCEWPFKTLLRQRNSTGSRAGQSGAWQASASESRRTSHASQENYVCLGASPAPAHKLPAAMQINALYSLVPAWTICTLLSVVAQGQTVAAASDLAISSAGDQAAAFNYKIAGFHATDTAGSSAVTMQCQGVPARPC